MSKRKLVVGNWKMYLTSPEEAKKFASTLRRKTRLFPGVDVVITPPYTLLPVVAAALRSSSIKVGAQAVSVYDEAKHTGEVSATMLKAAGAQFCIVGHSERRAMGEGSEVVRAQLELAHVAGLTPILCIGEKERDAAGAHFTHIEEQLTSALSHVAKNSVPRLIVAYEPVWAIGKSAEEAMTPNDLREMSIFIKKTLAETFERKAALRVPILYGGSVEPSNAHALASEGDVDGFLVGHASAEVASFVEILRSCKK